MYIYMYVYSVMRNYMTSMTDHLKYSVNGMVHRVIVCLLFISSFLRLAILSIMSP